MRIINQQPYIAEIQAISGFRGCHYSAHICDTVSEFSALMRAKLASSTYHGLNDLGWNGGMNKHQTLQACDQGDMQAVPAADALLEKFEEMSIGTQAWGTVYDVCGGVANVPEYLAGNPIHMRRRQRVLSERGPLTIIVDLTTSGGISAKDVRNRGIAILALVRMLTRVRPVSLYVGCELDTNSGSYNNGAVFVRIDTAPLDLARAAHLITHPSVPRGLCYAFCKQVYHSAVHWGYGNTSNVAIQRKHGAAQMRALFADGSECLYLPAMFLRDESVKEPVKWIKTMLREHGGIEIEQA